MAATQSAPKLSRATTGFVLHTLLPSRRFWGKARNPAWARRHGQDYTAALRDQCAAPERCTAIAFFVEERSTGRLRFRIVPHRADTPLASLLHEGKLPKSKSNIYHLRGSRVVPVAGDAQDAVPISSVMLQKRYALINAVRRHVQNLVFLFERWMARFRGVALHHLTAYVALFETCLEQGLVRPPPWDPGPEPHWQRM